MRQKRKLGAAGTLANSAHAAADDEDDISTTSDAKSKLIKLIGVKHRADADRDEESSSDASAVDSDDDDDDDVDSLDDMLLQSDSEEDSSDAHSADEEDHVTEEEEEEEVESESDLLEEEQEEQEEQEEEEEEEEQEEPLHTQVRHSELRHLFSSFLQQSGTVTLAALEEKAAQRAPALRKPLVLKQSFLGHANQRLCTSERALVEREAQQSAGGLPVTDWLHERLQKSLPGLSSLLFPQQPASSGSGEPEWWTPLQRALLPYLRTYTDLLFTDQRFTNLQELRVMTAVHCLNHCLMAQEVVASNNAALKKKQQQQHSSDRSEEADEEEDEEEDDEEDDDEDQYRDQGFTRPKVLWLVPFRSSALAIVEVLQHLFSNGNATKVKNLSRFRSEYKEQDEAEEEAEEEQDNNNNNNSNSNSNNNSNTNNTNQEEEEGAAQHQHRSTRLTHTNKPADYQFIMSGNTDDCFRLGISLGHNFLRLFSPFYSSDILIASPLGLKLIIGDEGDAKREYDFLSSVQLLVVDQADVLYMQNFEHVQLLFDVMNLMPQRDHGTDYSRVAHPYLNGFSKFYRQSILYSGFPLPELTNLFTRRCYNYRGFVSLSCTHAGTIEQVAIQLSQVYTRFRCRSLATSADDRFQFFKDTILPEIQSTGSMPSHTLLFIPSYFDFIRVRNLLKQEMPYSMTAISEYSSHPNRSRAKSRFLAGKKRVLLYTERAHFFHRMRIPSIKHIVFYSLPLYAHFYPEILNWMTSGCTCKVLVCQYDALVLERVIGTQRLQQIAQSKKNEFLFC